MLKLTLRKRVTKQVDNQTTGADARLIRQLRGISGRRLARKMGYSPMYISALERGNKNWNQSLVDAFNMALNFLMREAKGEKK